MALLRVSRLRWLLAAIAALLLAGCATGGYSGGGYGGGYGYPDRYGQQSLQGTVRQVDPYRNRIVMSQGRYGGRIELFYDRGTRLYYQGRQLPVEGLEPGDGIRVAATRSGNRWWAQSIQVVHNVRDAYGGGYGGTDRLRGEVIYVDPRARIIEVATGYGRYGDRARVRYDHRTVVEYRGRRYRPGNLERGDIVRIQLRRWGNGWLAERVWVERDVSWR